MKIGREWIAVLDFGSQYTRLITRRIREQKVYSEIIPFNISPAALQRRRPAGIILSGGPASVFAQNAPACSAGLFQLGIPILGICYGMQLTAKLLGGAVKPGQAREYGQARLALRPERAALFKGLPRKIKIWMSHGDQVAKMPPGFRCLAATPACAVAAMADPARKIYGLQFHPEVVHTPQGGDILHEFLFSVCGCKGKWAMARFVKESIKSVRKRLGKAHVICGLSGGVDSSVVALLLHRAVGRQLHCIFVDNGLLRAGEVEQVEKMFRRHFGLDLHVVRAAPLFLKDLAGITDPETKRKLIGKRFVQVFSAEARRFGRAKYLAQGTLYPDVIESSPPNGGPAATIKSHHNVGGLPPDLKFNLIEPLRELFKDEARAVGRELGLPPEIVNRQPFPGPGLAVRIIGEVTAARVAILQKADRIIQEEISAHKSAPELWQAFAILLPVKTVGVMGDGRTYENVCVLRAVTSRDGMTADWARLSPALLARISGRITNEVKGINRVVYDISSKPPATIEWE
ncbi:MAG: glutamine-hydrolyzing GMP synthase [Kiritimatiellae bacterium]|nr:glutamine-hydrolyzing GMP synthase [Kiritimatiellia bacterium]